MTRLRASLFAAVEIFGWIAADTIQAGIDLFVLLRLLHAPEKLAPITVRQTPKRFTK